MPAWGVKGGGPNTDQQLDTVIEYLWSVQITPDEVHKQVDDAVKQAVFAMYCFWTGEMALGQIESIRRPYQYLQGSTTRGVQNVAASYWVGVLSTIQTIIYSSFIDERTPVVCSFLLSGSIAHLSLTLCQAC